MWLALSDFQLGFVREGGGRRSEAGRGMRLGRSLPGPHHRLDTSLSQRPLLLTGGVLQTALSLSLWVLTTGPSIDPLGFYTAATALLMPCPHLGRQSHSKLPPRTQLEGAMFFLRTLTETANFQWSFIFLIL